MTGEFDPKLPLGGSRIPHRSLTLKPISLVAISCFDLIDVVLS